MLHEYENAKNSQYTQSNQQSYNIENFDGVRMGKNKSHGNIVGYQTDKLNQGEWSDKEASFVWGCYQLDHQLAQKEDITRVVYYE